MREFYKKFVLLYAYGYNLSLLIYEQNKICKDNRIDTLINQFDFIKSLSKSKLHFNDRLIFVPITLFLIETLS